MLNFRSGRPETDHTAATGLRGFLGRLVDDLEVVIRHAIGMAVTILCIWAFHALLEHTLGHDATLFDRLPIVYLAHTGDLLAMCRFFWKIIKEF